jgi:hypothetical protein
MGGDKLSSAAIMVLSMREREWLLTQEGELVSFSEILRPSADSVVLC